MSEYCFNQTDKEHTQKAALIKQGSLMFCQYRGGHKIAYVGAREIHKIQDTSNKDRSRHLLKSGSCGEQQ